MTSSKTNNQVIALLDRIRKLLDPAMLQERIDDPIDRVLNTFVVEESDSFSTPRFHRMIADFVGRIYREALPIKQNLSPAQACAEAIDLLQEYQGTSSNGYAGAFYDASQDNMRSVFHVVEQIAAIVKRRQRNLHQHAVFATVIDPFDWSTKVRLVEFLLESLQPLLSPVFLSRSITGMTEEWQELALLYLEMENSEILQKIFSMKQKEVA